MKVRMTAAVKIDRKTWAKLIKRNKVDEPLELRAVPPQKYVVMRERKLFITHLLLLTLQRMSMFDRDRLYVSSAHSHHLALVAKE